jgi:hypothetical protein
MVRFVDDCNEENKGKLERSPDGKEYAGELEMGK